MKTQMIITFGIGALVGGLLAAKLLAQPAQPVGVAPAGMTTSRWTSQYQGPAYGYMPGAGVAEKLYPNIHKATAFSPPSIYQPTELGNGNIIYID